MEQEQNTMPKDDAFPTVTAAEKSNLSMLVGVGAFLIILAGLGWYVMQNGISAAPVTSPASIATTTKVSPVATTGTEDAAAAALSAQRNSDEISSIEEDLKATNLDSLNDINAI